MIRPIVAIALLAALTFGSPAAAQRSDWPLRDRTLVGDGTVVTAVAAAIDRVVICSRDGVLLLDPSSRKFTGPYQPPDPSLLGAVRSALLDPLDQSVWIQLGDGWLRFDPTIELWERGRAPGPVRQIALDGDNPTIGLYLLVGSAWYQVPRGSTFPIPAAAPHRPVRPMTVDDVTRQLPGFAGFNGNGIPDGRNGLARITSAAADPGGRGWWLGTAGAGLVFIPFGQVNPERIPFGLPSTSVAALFAVPGGVWAVTDQLLGRRSAIVRLSSDLSSIQWHEGPDATGLPFRRASSLAGANRTLWLGTEVGLLRIDNGSLDLSRIDEGAGLPDGQVLTVLARRGRILAGTARGLVSVSDSGRVTALSQTFSGRITALAMVGDTIWAGGALGPMILRPGGELSEPAGLDPAPAYRAPVVAMVTVADTVVVLTTERLQWRDPVTGTWKLGPLLESSLGRLESLVAARGRLVVAGDRAVGFVSLNGLPNRVLQVPLELPAAPRDLAVDDDYLWVATSAGLVRWRLDALAP